MPQPLLQGAGLPHVARGVDHGHTRMLRLFLPPNDAAGKRAECLPDIVLRSHYLYGNEFVQCGQRVQDIKLVGTSRPLLRFCRHHGPQFHQHFRHGARRRGGAQPVSKPVGDICNYFDCY